MRITWMKAAGFLLPTAAIVTSLHLAKESSVGEALDGVLSSFWFAALFFMGSLAGLHLSGPERGRPGARRHVLEGMVTGAVVWGLLWAAWQLVPSEAIRLRAFAVNSAAVLVAGLAVTLARLSRHLVQGRRMRGGGRP